MAGRDGKAAHRRGRGGAPMLYEHRPDRALVMRTSADNRHAHEDSTSVIAPPVTTPAYYPEDVLTNAALESADWDYGLGDESLPPEPAGADGISMRMKAKRNRNSDLPFLTWVEFRDKYLDECLLGEGRGMVGHTFQACFVGWSQWARVGRATRSHTGFYLHNDEACQRKFTVIDVTGIHTVTLQFCCCDDSVKPWQQLMRVRWWPATVGDPSTCATFGVIRLFQNMNCLGKVSGYHFLRALELLTNSDGLKPPPNRRRAFMYIVRQHRILEMMKRAGRGHSNGGIGGTAQGELALPCCTCPQPGRNLPDGWDNIDWTKMPEDLSYKYFLFLAQDCNFRLINWNISTEVRDPVIDDGLGYFVNREQYKAFLRNHVEEDEISSCSGFQAMFLANTKRVKGLRTTGVGGVTCARHNMWRPNGIGDLQHGERYCNMDFILFSAILNAIFMFLILSCDIACQYSKNFWTRMLKLPEQMHIDPKQVRVWFKVPNFHMLGHKPPCHSPYSFHWMWGGGATDGEDVEQNWEFTNGAAGSTKMMGLGAHAAFLEYLFAFHNWMRTVSYRIVFTRHLARDLKQAREHRDAFSAFTKLLEAESPELVAKWKGWVEEWEAEQHTDEVGSPYEMTKPVSTMQDIWLRLGKEELTRTGGNIEVEKEQTSSTVITMGLDIEQTQGRNAGGELKESLDDLQAALHIRTMTNRFRHQNTAGQRALTRGQGILRQITIRIHKAKLRYHYARNAMLRLRSHAGWEKEFPVLKDEDVRGINERTVGEEEEATREGAGRYCGGRYCGWGEHPPNVVDLAHDEALCVEWCKAYSLNKCWHEDIVLVDKEMRPTIEYGDWEIRAMARTERMGPALAEGLRAYAMEQVEQEKEVCSRLALKWGPLRHRAREYLAGLAPEQEEELVVELEGDVEGDEAVDGAGEEENDTDDES
ncbi:hypothetical protein C8R43DRAFT_960209 [Mycena crocata]|nr:hypothetical protein C8R43DRAFT_960209 [Mycena crocata]